jgi:hypothetical protein
LYPSFLLHSKRFIISPSEGLRARVSSLPARHSSLPHSWRNAAIGSTFATRTAGMIAAQNAETASALAATIRAAGIPAVDLISLDYGPLNLYWHTPLDTIGKCSPQSLGIVARVLLKSLDYLEKPNLPATR